jgi:hypothetical protein
MFQFPYTKLPLHHIWTIRQFTTTCVFCDIHSSQKKTSMSDYLQRSKDIWCNGNFVYGNWNIKPRAISFWNVDTIHYNLYQFILTNMVILFKVSSWPRSHCNQCQSPSGNSRLTSYGAWRSIPNIPVCVLYLVRLLVILCQ